MKGTLLLSALLFICTISFAKDTSHEQIKRTCASVENLSRLKSQDPELESRMKQIESLTNAYIANKKNVNKTDAVITIPVVFHILYLSPSQNITDAQCQAQINQLNLDFAKMNSDTTNIPAVWQTVAAKINIQFCLAQRDPNGLATTGIERRNTMTMSFTSDDKVKFTATGGMNAWPSSSYLNIWSANLSGNLLGYAQFPGGPSNTDGVVLQFSSVGSMIMPGMNPNYGLGRTATHEVGHWLNLRHVWGDDTDCSGTDNVGDTPNQGTENYGCPSFPLTDSCSTAFPGVMFMNYMDYSDDGCMNMFTGGQSSRMNALFSLGGPRASLLNSTGCQAPSAPTCGVATGLNAASITYSGATLNWGAVTGAVSYSLKYKKSTSTSWTVVSATTNSKTVSNLLSNSVYQWQVVAICSMGAGAASVVSTFTTLVAPPCGIATNLTSSSINANGATLGWTAVSGAYGYTIQYQVTGAPTWTTTTSSTNSKILSGLINGTNYTFQVMATCTSGPGIYSSTSTFTTLLNNCTDTNEPNNTYLTPTLILTGVDITGQINTASDADWFTFTTVAPNTKMLIVLSNLAKNYDIRLYSSTFAQIGYSLATGIANDTIKKNLNLAGTYYLKVFGNVGAFSATQCYNLRVDVSNTNFRIADEISEVENIPSRQAEMRVFPNPVKDNLNIILTTETDQTVVVRVYDMVGKTVNTIPVEAIDGENKLSLDFSEYHRGIYFVEMIEGEKRITKKIIVE